MNPLVLLMAEAIAHFEGFYDSKNLAARNHNPGNLRSWSGYPTDGAFAVFPDAQTGFEKLRRQIVVNINRQLTLLEFFAGKKGVYPGYAPSSDDNDPARYAQFVARFVSERGIPLSLGSELHNHV